ncbi:hypothetical protein TREES_T100014124 [Tupaia chinensis]|uniref:Uncharacterized protein n=1 Tax=Tupaia chinensis TaxID=246437 RepID=L9KKJ3_TUPCH|nr:hypothetical protein TREES_T100014124 [Tupaia chinensis]
MGWWAQSCEVAFPGELAAQSPRGLPELQKLFGKPHWLVRAKQSSCARDGQPALAGAEGLFGTVRKAGNKAEAASGGREERRAASKRAAGALLGIRHSSMQLECLEEKRSTRVLE